MKAKKQEEPKKPLTGNQIKGSKVMNDKSPGAMLQKSDKLEYMKELYVNRGLPYVKSCELWVKKFGDTDRNARKYVKKIKDEMNAKKMENQGFFTNQALMRYNELYNKLFDAGRYKEAAEVQAKIDKITGIESAKRIDINQNVNQKTIDLSRLPGELLDKLLEQGFTDYEEVTDDDQDEE